MALTLKRRTPAPGQQELPMGPPTGRVSSAQPPKATTPKPGAVSLDDVFGTDEPVKAPAQPLYHSGPGELHGIGEKQRVVITNDKFPWITAYKPGDTGVVTRVHDQRDTARTYPQFDPTKHGLYEVTFDQPRTIAKMDFPRWAIEPIAAVHRVEGR